MLMVITGGPSTMDPERDQDTVPMAASVHGGPYGFD